LAGVHAGFVAVARGDRRGIAGMPRHDSPM